MSTLYTPESAVKRYLAVSTKAAVRLATVGAEKASFVYAADLTHDPPRFSVCVNYTRKLVSRRTYSKVVGRSKRNLR